MPINSETGIGFESLDPKNSSGWSSGVKTQPKRVPGLDQGVGHPGVLGNLGTLVVAPKCRPTRVASSSLDSRVFLSRFRKFDSCLGGGCFCSLVVICLSF